jgi:hypothetical protein
VRLEGGLGDHILGMRALRFVRQRFPTHDIIAYSDAAGHPVPLQIASMCPHVAQAIAVHQDMASESGSPRALDRIAKGDLERMQAFDVMIDLHGALMCVDVSVLLGVPLFSILGERPELSISEDARGEAARILASHHGAKLVGMNFGKYNAAYLRRHAQTIVEIVRHVLRSPSAILLNFFTTSYDFAHWPEPQRTARRVAVREGANVLWDLCALDRRVIPCVDLPISVVAALLNECSYYVGVDNGLKHLAWALGVPCTYFHPEKPDMRHILRWMPDVHRMLLFDCIGPALESHMRDISAALL